MNNINKNNMLTSYGIIAIHIINDNTVYKNIQQFLKSLNEIRYELDIECVNDDAKKLFIEYKEKLEFLMVSKKYTYGFLDIIKGHYTLNYNEVINLLNQMTELEIERLKNDDFDIMWNEIRKSKNNNNYEISKKKFLCFKNNLIGNEYGIIKKYNEPDWEFPKGKKNNFEEDDMKCAIREFKEETKLKNKDFKVYKNIAPIVEYFKGTDEKQYKYIYYIALLRKNTVINQSIPRIESSEIGYYHFDDAITKIRAYYKCRKMILYSIFTNIVNWVVNNKR